MRNDFITRSLIDEVIKEVKIKHDVDLSRDDVIQIIDSQSIGIRICLERGWTAKIPYIGKIVRNELYIRHYEFFNRIKKEHADISDEIAHKMATDENYNYIREQILKKHREKNPSILISEHNNGQEDRDTD